MAESIVEAVEHSDLLATVEAIGLEVSGPAADSVDKESRFPHETFRALRSASALSAAVPTELGGAGCAIDELGAHCFAIGRHCGSSGLILAMHHVMIASLARHINGSKFVRDYLRRCVVDQRLIASATSEVGPSGDMRSSVCAIEQRGDSFHLIKQATTISYGDYADDILVTARKNSDAAPGDQVMALALEGDYTITNKGSWDTLGMRGTCSEGGTIEVHGAMEQIVGGDFGNVATLTKVPYAHILWSWCWLGIATDAVAKARFMLRAKARKQAGTIPHLAFDVSDLNLQLQSMRNSIEAVANEYTQLNERGDLDSLASVAFAIRLNNLKINTSEMLVDIVSRSLRLIGIMAYKNDSEYSLSRHIRDSHSAALMVNNDRIRATNASLLLVHKGD